MKVKFFALLIVWAFALSGAGAIIATAQTGVKKIQANRLVNLLPASDGVMTLNLQKALNEALPQVLSGNQTMLTDVLRHIDDVKAKTGIDLRQFQEIAVGVSGKKNAALETEFEPVILARGTFDANAFPALFRTVTTAKYRQEKIGSRTVYIFTPKTAAAPQSKKSTGVFERAVDRMFDNLSRGIAVAVFDDKTLVIGTPVRLRETFGTGARLGTAVLNLINRKPDAIMSFGLRLPEGLSPFVNLGDDELGKDLGAIRFMAGAADFADGNAVVSILARTVNAEQAKSLHQQIEGFKNLGPIFLGSAKGADKQVFGRMLENVKIERNLTDITLDLQVPQSDIDILLTKSLVTVPAPK